MTGSPARLPYRERLRVSLRWWVQAVMFFGTVWLAMAVAMPLAWSLLVTGFLFAICAALFVWTGSALIEVSDGELRAGRARIGLDLVGVPESLDREQTRAALGPQADARGYLLTRPWLHTAVRVPITDPADPTPYWLLHSRRPDRLAAAISSARAMPSVGGSD